ncbi:alpha-adducin-like [Branchiostoma floridae x Branchiostoma japonicum]
MLQVWNAIRHVYNKGTLSLVSRTNDVHTSAAQGCPIPINDLHRVSPDRYTQKERDERCKLAALYRLVHQEGWTQYIYNHITAQVGEGHHFLLNPFGLLYEEVTASNLLKVNLEGEVIDPGTTLLGVNLAGYLLHSAIHAARPDVRCVVHIHSPYAAAVSTMKCGLLPMSQEALLLGEISYHPYSGILVDQTEREAIAKNLGPKNKVMMLQNHGMVACGESIEEAWVNTYGTIHACEIQVQAMGAGVDNLLVLDGKSLWERTAAIAASEDVAHQARTQVKWASGQLEFEAMMRKLDRQGHQTGYPYQLPEVYATASEQQST